MPRTTSVKSVKRKSDGQTPEMRIEMWPIDRPVDYPKNARKWSQSAIDKVTTSLREFGFRQPIVVDKHDVIIIGHLRRVAARAAGFTQVPVHVADLPAGKVRQLRLMDNRSHDEAQWDLDILAEEMAELSKLDLDLSFTGFDEREYVSFMTGGGLTDPDEVPETPAVPVTQAGDLWLMGAHRLLCGDSTSSADVALLMGGQSADLVFTSPPYLDRRDYESGSSPWIPLMCGVFGALNVSSRAQLLVNLGLVHKDGRCIPYWEPWLDWMESKGWRRFGWYVWDQSEGLPGDWSGRFAPSHEFVFHLNRESVKPAKWVDKKPESIRVATGTGMRRKDGSMQGGMSSPNASLQPTKIPDSVIRATRQKGGIEGHPAPFSVGFAECIVKSWSGIVCDPFTGSGSTVIACELHSRACYGLEIEPKYTDVIVQRWQNFTGKAATLDGDGRTFAEIAAERAA